ncbi:MAG: sigma-70 family RNA polymerase sigma factor, partial [Chthonomonadales bacterium]
ELRGAIPDNQKLSERSEAEDAVQETFIRTYKALPAYRPDGYFSSWIYRIALNECRRRLRSKKVTVPLDLVDGVSNTPDPQNAMLTGERNRLVRAAVNGLPEHYRVVMMLFYFEEMSVDQISKTINVSVSAVKVRLHRGRERLSTRISL